MNQRQKICQNTYDSYDLTQCCIDSIFLDIVAILDSELASQSRGDQGAIPQTVYWCSCCEKMRGKSEREGIEGSPRCWIDPSGLKISS
jgi:hypothetical protein